MSDIRTTRRDGQLWITVDRPEVLNALRRSSLEELRAAVESATDDPTTRVIVLTGAGRGFCSGAELTPGLASSADDVLTIVNGLVRAMRESPLPVIAAVNGPAVGAGASLAFAADLIVAAESAYFLLSFARLGLMPDAGATATVAAAVGRIRATEMALLAERLPAAQAHAWGLITRVVPDGEFTGHVESLAARIAAGPPEAFARIKAALNGATLAGLPQALTLEHLGQLQLFATADAAEGVAAFQEHRMPRFGDPRHPRDDGPDADGSLDAGRSPDVGHGSRPAANHPTSYHDRP